MRVDGGGGGTRGERGSADAPVGRPNRDKDGDGRRNPLGRFRARRRAVSVVVSGRVELAPGLSRGRDGALSWSVVVESMRKPYSEKE